MNNNEKRQIRGGLDRKKSRRDLCHYETNGVSKCFLLIWVSMTLQEEKGRKGEREKMEVEEGDRKEKINDILHVSLKKQQLWQ